MRVVPDSNTIFSALYYPNAVPGRGIQLVRDKHTLILVDYCLDELRRAVKKRKPFLIDRMDEFIETANYELFELPKNWHELLDVPHIRDPNDEAVLAAAILANADVIITGDKDFSSVVCPGIMIMNPREFLDWSENL